MLENGFISVGKSFPVFLHPKTKEEYALARKEIKVELGHKGFKFDVNKDIVRRRFSANKEIEYQCNSKV